MTRHNPPNTSHYPFDFESNIFEKTTLEINNDLTIQHKIEKSNSEIEKLWKKAKELGKDAQKNSQIDDEYISKNRNQNEQILKYMNDILVINNSLSVVLYNKGACLARLNIAVDDVNDEPESFFRKAIKEKPDYSLAFKALSERVASHNDTLMYKYNPDLAHTNVQNSWFFSDIVFDLANFEDFWDAEELLEKARMCVHHRMFQTSLLFFRRGLLLSDTDATGATLLKEEADVLKELSKFDEDKECTTQTGT